MRARGLRSVSVVSSSVFIVLLAIGCGGGSGSPSGGGGHGGDGGSSSTGGTTGSTGGTTGPGGSSSTGGTTGAGGSTATGGATGAGKTTAVAQISQSNGDGVMGTATFMADATGVITLTLMAKNCQTGAHAFHLTVNANCQEDGTMAGASWSPKGDGLGTITCNGGNGGMATFKEPSVGYWTIGTGDAATDVDLHAVVIYSGTDAKLGNPIACGIPRSD